MAMTSEVSQKINDISERLLAGKPLDSDMNLSLDEFASLYHAVSQRAGVEQRIDVVLQNDRAFAQFTSLPPGNAVVYIVSDHRLTPRDFTRIVAKLNLHGDVLTPTVRARIEEERTNLLVAGGVGLFFFFLLFSLGSSEASSYAAYLATPGSFPSVERIVNVMIQINEMLLTSATLFLSIFLVFTVAQSTKLQEDIRLFDYGLLHKFERDDRLVALCALASLLLSVLNAVTLGLPASWEVASWQIRAGYVVVFNKLSLVSPLMTGLTVGTLVFCFMSLVYYLKRTILITNRDMSEKVLAKARQTVQAGKQRK